MFSLTSTKINHNTAFCLGIFWGVVACCVCPPHPPKLAVFFYFLSINVQTPVHGKHLFIYYLVCINYLVCM